MSIKRWSGSIWNFGTPFSWNGSEWAESPLWIWDGSQWIKASDQFFASATQASASNCSNVYLGSQSDSFLSFDDLRVGDATQSIGYLGFAHFITPDVNIPNGSDIISAKLGIYSNDTSGGDFGISIDDIDSASVLSSAAAFRSEVTNNSYGKVSANFSSSLTEIDITPLVSRVIHRDGWVSGNTLGFFVFPYAYPSFSTSAYWVSLARTASNYINITYA